ncbi:PKD domain-containing protein [Janibacter alittae]|uniref:PKD domain-containing protein n=1 Tax=Janibacter alittae TaxID=3115209 RepID=A0ABZ2MLA4_9MICO
MRDELFWAATPPAGPGAPLPDPRDLAEQAVAKMGLRAPEIGIVPEPGEGNVGVVGMPTWMWVEDADSRTLGPITRQASASGHTVTANAKVSKLQWEMGEGTTVTCTGPGTAYADSYGKQDSPDCGHRYNEQGEYTVTVNATWTITWSGLGQSGRIPMTLERSTTITMGEVQVLN